MGNNLQQAVCQTLAQYQMLETDDTVMCGVSGGADSVALLCALHEAHIKVCACHLNHCLRGEEADRDEQFVQALCASLDISCFTSSRDVAQYAAAHTIGIEEAARAVRYAFYEEAALVLHAGKIATAHTADDNFETMLFHLTRGTGAQGLCGIPPTRGRIIRPLLSCTRAEVEEYLASRGQPFVQDSTNASTEYTRNRVRLEIVPILRQLNPRCAQAATRASRLLRQDQEYLHAQADALRETLCTRTQDTVQMQCAKLCEIPPALRGRVLRGVLADLQMPMENCTDALIERLFRLAQSKNPSATLSLPGKLSARRAYEALAITRYIPCPPCPEIPVFIGFDAVLWDSDIRLTITERKINFPINKMFNTFYAECGKINFETLTVRKRQTGDTLQLTMAGGKRSLKRLLIDRHIPRDARDRLAVLADCGGVVAVQGLGADCRRAPSGDAFIEIRFEGIGK